MQRRNGNEKILRNEFYKEFCTKRVPPDVQICLYGVFGEQTLVLNLLVAGSN